MKRLTVVMFMLAGTLLAQGPGGPGFRHNGMGPRQQQMQPAGNADALKQYLGLTDAQVQQLKDLRKQQAESQRPVMEQIRDKRQQLRDAVRAANPDAALIGQLTVDIKKLTESMLANRTDLQAKAQALLTPDQKTKMAALEQAQKLMPAAGQATSLGLLAPLAGTAGQAGMGPGMMGRPRQGRMMMRPNGPPPPAANQQ
ncbi:Spy/CpxP family protein refolding chaperone [Paludibaculum fermentans]|uniref:Periplasmic heavy metal sensor n=1 Tax=Paludibaculum fermentans TaxID=1473598 RepID=A0A7S7SID7_PALFE|nr:periplasmic heavy metal sensor [Paludibaculum fermentans]QOY85356.1 periplasmic heavy metal sensor [Paludibaculum fermentans]